MRNQSKSKKVRLGISVGDINGIGLEVIMKAFSDNRIFDLLRSISSLKKVFLWDTRVSSTQLKNQLAQFEKIEIIGSLE